MRTIFIGDVHGCFGELEELLKKVRFVPKKDRLIFLGDLINRGPDSGKVLSLVRSLPCEAILGNHEVALLRHFRGEKGGYLSLKRVVAQLKGHGGWLAKLPVFIETDEFLAVHAGLVPGLSLEEHPLDVITRIRTWGGDIHDLDNPDNPPWFDLYTGEKLVVYGHWAARGLTVREKTIGLDSGCVWGGALSALLWPSGEIVQVKAKKNYVERGFP